MTIDFPEGIPKSALRVLKAGQNVVLPFWNKCLDPVKPTPRYTDKKVVRAKTESKFYLFEFSRATFLHEL